MGTHVVSGTATAARGAHRRATEFGKISERLAVAAAGDRVRARLRRFGYLLMEVTLRCSS